MEQGIITIASGADTYIRMALTLGRSVRLHNPHLSMAVVTDRNPAVFSRLFDQVIPIRLDLGPPLRQKLCLLEYSPFEQTLFIDADCMVFGDLEWIFKEPSTEPILLEGEQSSTGFWYADVPALCRKLKVQSIPKFNSGAMVLRRGGNCLDLMADARSVWDAAAAWEIMPSHGAFSDEPAISVAMARMGVKAHRFSRRLMGAPWIEDFVELRQNVLRGECVVTGRYDRCSPVICHYLIGSTHWKAYKRDAITLRLHQDARVPTMLATACADVFALIDSTLIGISGARRKLTNTFHGPRHRIE